MKAMRLLPFERGVRAPPDYTDARVLGAAVEETHTVPAGAAMVVFSANGDFYARLGATAAVPAADVADGTASELNPAEWAVSPAQVIHLVAPAAAIVTLSFYGGAAT